MSVYIRLISNNIKSSSSYGKYFAKALTSYQCPMPIVQFVVIFVCLIQQIGTNGTLHPSPPKSGRCKCLVESCARLRREQCGVLVNKAKHPV